MRELVKHTVASTGRKEHKSEVFEALASSIGEENYLPAGRILDGCKHGWLRSWTSKFFEFLLFMRVQCIHWSLATCVAAGEGHDPHFEHLILLPLPQGS